MKNLQKFNSTDNFKELKRWLEWFLVARRSLFVKMYFLVIILYPGLILYDTFIHSVHACFE